jgi:Spy/CpxP family protein refolding chaperone
MKAATLLLVTAAAVAVMLPAGGVSAQAPQVTPPADPKAELPQSELDELIGLLDCDCECECCERIKKRIKKRLKDRNARPMLAPEKSKAPRRGPRAKLRPKKRGTRRHHAQSKYERPRPRTGDRWLDAARTHKLRKARRNAARRLNLTTEQRDAIRELRHQEQLETIDLKAGLEKRRLDLKHLMRNADASESDVRALVDSIARIRADIRFLELKTRLRTRALLSDEQRTKLKR